MNNTETCPFELRVLSAIGGPINDALRLHLESCSSCHEVKQIAETLRQFAARPIATLPPDPDVIWMMARLSKPRGRWTSEVRAGIAALVASVLLAVWMWSPLSAYLSILVPKSAANTNALLTSCIIAAAIAAVAANSIRRMNGE